MNKVEGYTTLEGTVMEMTSDGADDSIKIPVDSALLDKLKSDDSDPMFVTIEVLNEGVSRNGRKWDKDLILSVAEQINSKRPDGYYGHLAEDERHNKFPEPQTIWLGASVEEIGGKLRLFAKGYVLPEAKVLRSYLKKAKHIGKNVAVSVYGTAKAVKDNATNIITMSNFDLESIDWARPGAEGVRNMGLFSVTSEMNDDSNKHKGDDMDRLEAIKSANADELQLNPVVSEMVNEAVSAKDAELTSVVSEMADIKQTLGLDSEASVVTVVSEMKAKLDDMNLDSRLRNDIEVPAARKFVKQLVVAEMKSGVPIDEAVDKVLASETGQSIVKEMIDTAPRVAPRVERPAVTTRKFTTK